MGKAYQDAKAGGAHAALLAYASRKMEKSQVIVEELMSAAIDAGRAAAARAGAGDAFAQGQVLAYYDILDILREQATLLGVSFADARLAKFDPDELLCLATPAAKTNRRIESGVKVQVEPAATLCLAQAVQQLIDEAGPKAGQTDALLAWAVLTRIKANALAFGVPLAEIGLDRFDPDQLLKRPAKQAA